MTDSATTAVDVSAPSPPDEFAARLRAQGTRYHNLHPFHQRMDAGELTRDELQRWVTNRFYYQKCIPLKDAAIMANCDEVAVRREWVQRIVDHDGTAEGTGGIESWLRLGEALGVSRAELVSERRVLPAVRYAVDAYVNFARSRPWVEAVASSLTELFGPAAIRVRLEALERHYPWIDRAGLEYFRARLVQAPRDAQYALDLTVEAIERVGAETFIYGTRQHEIQGVAANPGELPPGEVIVRIPGATAPAIGERIRAIAPPEKLHLFSADGRQRVER